MKRTFGAAALSVTLASLIAAAPAKAADEDFFKGKTITIYIGFSPGGTYDLFGRMVGRFIGKHIPGNPTVVASNMPGAGSFTRTPAYTLAGAKAAVVPTASTGPGSPSDTYPKLMNEVAGTKFKIIRGFPGSTDGLLAVERGETEAALTSWNTMKSTRMHWLTDKKAALFVQYVTQRSPDLKDVPTLVELATNEDDRKLLAFAVSSAEIGRSILAPPGLPADRTALLRKAFDATMKDPELLAEIQKSNLDFEPLDGASLAKIVAAAANADEKVVARMQKITEE